MKINWIKTQNSISLNYDGEAHTVLNDSPQYAEIIEALKNKDYDHIPELVSLAKQIEKKSNGAFTVVNNQVMIDDFVVPDLVGQKIMEFYEDELPFEPLVAFARKLNKNPSYRSVQQLYGFLEAGHFCITDDGDFVAYKKVTKDFKDLHTGTFDNSPGKVVEIPRNQVDENPEKTCSNGLHVCSRYYLDFIGGENDVVVEVLVNPEHVVCVPVDYKNSKMRVSRYQVLDVAKHFRTEKIMPKTIYSSSSDNYEDDYSHKDTYESEYEDREFDDEFYSNDV